MKEEPLWERVMTQARATWRDYPGLEEWLGTDYLPQRLARLTRSTPPLVHHLVGTARGGYLGAGYSSVLRSLEDTVTSLRARYPRELNEKALTIARSLGPQERLAWWSTMAELAIFSVLERSSTQWTLREEQGPDACLEQQVWLEVTHLDWPFLDLLIERLGRNPHWQGWRLAIAGMPTSMQEVDGIGSAVERKLRELEPHQPRFIWHVGAVTISGRYVGYAYFVPQQTALPPSVVASALTHALKAKARQAAGQRPYVVAVDVSDMWDQLHVHGLWGLASTVHIPAAIDAWYPFIRSTAPLGVAAGKWFFNPLSQGQASAAAGIVQGALPNRTLGTGPLDFLE